MRVLVACEESQAVCKAFRELGHEAYSCDIQECSGGHPEWHIQGDVLPLLKEKWDLIIAHPPCTYLTNAGARWLWAGHELNKERYQKGLAAKEFFMAFYNADCPRIAIENPVPSAVFELPKYNQVIQPYEYGHSATKKTCLWLKGLPKLVPTNIVEKPVYEKFVQKNGHVRRTCWEMMQKGGKERAKERSKTFPGIARAMAEQWGGIIEKKGKWILTDKIHYGTKEYVCSECKQEGYWKGHYCYGNENECPNCGAKMDL